MVPLIVTTPSLVREASVVTWATTLGAEPDGMAATRSSR
jgi:hypothetical protein